MGKFYITTAIDYVNALPHLGTAYEKVGADVMARFRRMMGDDVFFQMGVDEHSLNVAKQAKANNMDTKVYCDKMANEFELVWHALDIDYDKFIRTTDPEHLKAVQKLFITINENGYIKEGKYTGWYCVSCERFIQEKELVDGDCPVHKKKPKWLEEENYFFKLSEFQDKLLEHIQQNPQFIEPEIRRNEILNVIKGGLDDISVSRSTESWGIPVPFNEKHVVYVWFDALINYITGAGYANDDKSFAKWWPADVHVIGKDITRFHAIIWPAMLMAAGVELPKSVFGHGFVYLGGEKMSKSAGTALDPVSLSKIFGPDPLRYFLMREISFDRDGNFLIEKYEERYNSDLANDWGNLVQRVLSMVNKYREGKVPGYSKVESDNGAKLFEDWKQSLNDLLESIEDSYEKMRFSLILTKIWELIQNSNRFVEEMAPWKLYKAKNDQVLDNTLNTLVEMIRIVNILIYPVMPTISRRIQQQLNIENPFLITEAKVWNRLDPDHILGKIEPMFPKVEK